MWWPLTLPKTHFLNSGIYQYIKVYTERLRYNFYHEDTSVYMAQRAKLSTTKTNKILVLATEND